MRKQNSLVRSGLLCGLTLGAYLIGTPPAVAEVNLLETDGWTFFTDGRINAFLVQGYGNDFPAPTPNPNVGPNGERIPPHTVVGSGQPFTAGYYSQQGNTAGKYNAMRVRSGFLGSILAFGMKRQVTESTTAKAYVSLWGTAQSFGRDRTTDAGVSDTKSFDVREGFISFDGPWGNLVAGRQGGVLGGMSTEIDFLYGHNYGLGLPCLDVYYPTCGHIGTGALGPGNAAGFSYVTPSIGGLKLKVALYDPVRLLGGWERVPYPRPEGALSFERRLSPALMFKLQVEGMYQYMGVRAETRSDAVWGVAGGGRIEAGPVRLGVSAFTGKGLGVYVALQNSGATFNQATKEFRSFTGVYAQGALVLGKTQVSAGVGRVIDYQLASDKIDVSTSGLKSQTGASAAFYYRVVDNVALGFDYFRFQTDWWGAPNSGFDATGAPVVIPGPPLKPETQLIHFVNVGGTYFW